MLEMVWDPEAAPIVDPVEALASLAGKAQHAVDVLGARVSADDLDSVAGIAWTRVMRELRQMLEGLERLGLEDRRTRIAEQVGAELAALVRRVLEQLELSVEQQELARVIVPAEFRRMSGQDGEAVRGELR